MTFVGRLVVEGEWIITVQCLVGGKCWLLKEFHEKFWWIFHAWLELLEIHQKFLRNFHKILRNFWWVDWNLNKFQQNQLKFKQVSTKTVWLSRFFFYKNFNYSIQCPRRTSMNNVNVRMQVGWQIKTTKAIFWLKRMQSKINEINTLTSFMNVPSNNFQTTK